MSDQHEYYVSAHACDVCHREIRTYFLMQIGGREMATMLLCLAHKNFLQTQLPRETPIKRECVHCGVLAEEMGAVSPMHSEHAAEVTMTTHDHQIVSAEPVELWCATCIVSLLAAGERHEIDVYDALTMDED